MIPPIPEPRRSEENLSPRPDGTNEAETTLLRMPGIRALYLRLLAEDDDGTDGTDGASKGVT